MNSQLANCFFSGEEICENYYPCFTHIDTTTRKKWLLKHYCFECKCIPCELNYKLEAECESYTTNSKWKSEGTSGSSFTELNDKCCELLNATEVLKKNVVNLQQEDMAGLQKTFGELCKIQTQLTTLLQPDAKEVLESNEFFHALLSKLSGNQ